MKNTLLNGTKLGEFVKEAKYALKKICEIQDEIHIFSFLCAFILQLQLEKLHRCPVHVYYQSVEYYFFVLVVYRGLL